MRDKTRRFRETPWLLAFDRFSLRFASAGAALAYRGLVNGPTTHPIWRQLKSFTISRKPYTPQKTNEPHVRAKMVKNRPYL